MSEKTILERLEQKIGSGKKKDLSLMEELMTRLGNPERQLTCIHVAGTNGKGSVSGYLNEILQAAGLTVGLFTSPHLEYIGERIKRQGEEISSEDLAHYTARVFAEVDVLEASGSAKFGMFEMLTAVAFLYFAEQPVDVLVLEAGVGGTLDVTNILKSEQELATVITSIGLDHQNVLGDSLADVAENKGGIMKAGVPMFVGPVAADIENLLKEHAADVQAPLTVLDAAAVKSTETDALASTQTFEFEDESYTLHMLGRHQAENAALAVLVSRSLNERGLTVSEDAIKTGLLRTRWGGRLEKLSEQPLLYVDGAHNPLAVARLVETLGEQFEHELFVFIIGMMEDKAYREMIRQVWDFAKEFLVVSPDPWRGFDADAVTEWIKDEGKSATSFKDVTSLREYLDEQSGSTDCFIQFGSLYLVGDLKKSYR